MSLNGTKRNGGNYKLLRSQHGSLEAHWLVILGDHCSNPGGGENGLPLMFLSHDLMIFELFNDFAN